MGHADPGAAAIRAGRPPDVVGGIEATLPEAARAKAEQGILPDHLQGAGQYLPVMAVAEGHELVRELHRQAVEGVRCQDS
jgi:hypothetical protein